MRSNRYEVVIREQTRRVLDKGKLPREILDDPAYFKVSNHPIVSVKALIAPSDADEGVVLIE